MLGNAQFPEQAFWLAGAGIYHHFFLWSSSIPLCACTSLFICSPFEGLVGCFQFAVIMNGATKEMDVWFLCGCKFPTSFVMPDCWIEWQNCGQLCKKLSNCPVKYCTIFISHQSFHVLISHWSCQVCFYLCPSNRCVVVSQCCLVCSSLVHIKHADVKHLFLELFVICISFVKPLFCFPTFWSFVFLLLSFKSLLYIWVTNPISDRYFGKYFLPTCAYLLVLLIVLGASW